MLLETLRTEWTRLSATNYTAASFTDYKSTALTAATKPDTVFGTALTNLIILGGDSGALTTNGLLFKFWGVGSNNNTFKIRLWGVDFWTNPDAQNRRSVELALICELLCTFGNSLTGVANCMITASDTEVDTIALTYGNANINNSIVSPANDVRGANVLVDVAGFGMVLVDGDLNSSATSWNAAYKRL
jgi:hypothetical protein